MQVLNLNPLVATVDGFATATECTAVIAAARDRLKRATTTLDGGFTAIEDDHRTNSYASLKPEACPALMALALKLSVLLRMPMDHAETAAVLHYLPGQRFGEHHDAFYLDMVVEGFEESGGQRLFTTILYLNRPEAGGATSFPHLKIEVAPQPGRLLVFANTVAGQRHPSRLATHSGEPVTAGEKWALTFWWREAPYTKPR